MDVEVSISALEGKTFEGNVSEISPSVDINTATYPVRVTVKNPTDEIKSGMAAEVTFDFGEEATAKPQLIIPAMAVGEDSNGNFVFIVEGKGTEASVRKQPIEIGELTGDGFVIKSGLDQGQRIATAGLQTLLDGQKVSLE